MSSKRVDLSQFNRHVTAVAVPKAAYHTNAVKDKGRNYPDFEVILASDIMFPDGWKRPVTLIGYCED